MTKKKADGEKPEKKPREKPVTKLPDEEAITRLFPKPLLEMVRERLDDGK